MGTKCNSALIDRLLREANLEHRARFVPPISGDPALVEPYTLLDWLTVVLIVVVGVVYWWLKPPSPETGPGL
jgi:hypothetical protein